MIRPENIPGFNLLAEEHQDEIRQKLKAVTLEDKVKRLEDIQDKIVELKHHLERPRTEKSTDADKWMAEKLDQDKSDIQRSILRDLIKKPREEVTPDDKKAILDLTGSIYEYFVQRDRKIFTDETGKQHNISPETIEWKNKLDQFKKDYGFENEESGKDVSLAN